jgi:hypothetical protein
MITLSGDSIMLVLEDGSMEAFRPEELQSRIYRSCIECGFNEPWLAEDIALSVEYLILKTQDKREFRKEEIFSFASRILEETGHVNIAFRFRKNDSLSDGRISNDSAAIADYLGKTLPSCAGSLLSISNKISSALRQIKIDRAAPQLVTGLALQYQKDDGALSEKVVDKIKFDADSPFLVSSAGLISSLEEKSERYISDGILSVCPLSKFFPSVKVSIRFAKFAELKMLAPPLTELALTAHFHELAGVVSDIRDKACDIYSSILPLPKDEIPLVLRASDSYEFAKAYLDIDTEAEKYVKKILAYFGEFFQGEVIVK